MYTTTKKQARKIRINFENHITNEPPVFFRKFFLWATIVEVKKELETELQVHHSEMRLFYKNLELTKNGRRLLDYNVKNRDTFVVRMTPKLEDSLGVINPYRIFEPMPEEIREMLDSVKSGFLKGIKPRLTENGTSGTYLLENHVRKIVAIFKPFDEEPFTPNNPRNFAGELGGHGFRSGILSGQSATREVAAFMLNQGYHGVPPTTYVQFYHPSFKEREPEEETRPINSEKYFVLENELKTKHGSIQMYAPHDDLSCNFGCNVFSVEEVHRIAILDLRILNCDRNEQNILVKKSQQYVETSTGQKLKKDYKLIPIDHGLSFPDNFHIYDYEIVWMDYPQVRQPLTEKELQFIAAIDPVADCKRLREKLGFREICLRNFRIAEVLLKTAASRGFTLHDIGRMLYRKEMDSVDSEQEENMPQDTHMSEIEKLVKEVEDLYFMMKDNGMATRIEHHLGVFKSHTKHKNKLLMLDKKMSAIKEEDDSQTETSQKDLRDQEETVSNERRSVSLPHIRHHLDMFEEVKDKPKQKDRSRRDIKPEQQPDLKRRDTRQARVQNEPWDEVFFHYFEDRLRLFLQEKQGHSTKRNRFKSEILE